MKGWRHYTLVGGFALGCVAVIVRLGYLNWTEREFLQEQGDARSVRGEVLPAYRGVVYDRHGEPLAVSTPVFAVWVDPSRARLTDESLESLAELLALDPAGLAASVKANEHREFLYVKRRVPWERAQAVRDLGISGVHLQSEYRRYYPASETTSHVVGTTGIEESGLEGIELSFDGRLRGEHGRKVVLKDQRGETIKDLDYVAAPKFGSDLNLSLDLRLQFLAYRELKSAVVGHRATSGSLVMLDARSGEILALVNQPSYNPNELGSVAVGSMRNRAVTDVYEPGSTVKPFTVLAALESGHFAADTVIDTQPGYFRVGSKLVQDPVNRGAITVGEALQVSSQVGIAKIALELEERAVYDVLNRAGVGEPINTGMPGEAWASLDDAGLASLVGRAALAYGYGLAISPLQLAQAYLTLATGGVRVPVSIVKQETVRSGTRVFDAEITEDVVRMMEGVTDDDGTAPKARVVGYRVAGKTGTARKVGAAGYDDERHVALFAGIAPVSDPRLVIVVVVNEPKGDARGGGSVAAPVFGRVAARSMRLLGVRPDGESA
ncbi:MAG: penicillin-binding protein 2 [Pseudomonadales bacterium]|nr:penicillin-binding protein 2 [Pseudomonadales bacterium]NIX06920.1 penicillin-binding protein 2 [Pseudomonadales bacterium]